MIAVHRQSPSMIVACVALAVALSGTSYAAFVLPANSVGTKQLKKRAVTSKKLATGAVTGAKVKNDSLTGANILESTLGRVAVATNADNAASAANAAHASVADSASPIGAAGGVLSGSYPNPGLARPEPWHEVGAAGEPPFFPGWDNSPGGETVAFYKDPMAVVHLKGMVRRVTGCCAAFMLPAGYRPDSTKVFASTTGNIGLPSSPGNFVDITTDGRVIPARETSSTAAPFWTLDGITFRVG
jgi:hypothetical protein